MKEHRVIRWIVSLVLIAALIGGGLSVAGWLYRSRPEPERRGIVPLPPLVEVETVRLEDVRERFLGFGSVRADWDATISAEVSGVIEELVGDLKDGVRIEQGAVLIRIDDRQYQRRLEQAESLSGELRAQIASLDVEKHNIEQLVTITDREVKIGFDEVERVGGLYEENRASKKELDVAQLDYARSRRTLQGYQNELALIEPRRATLTASLEARQAEAALARLDMERCAVRSPADGEVVRVFVKKGDFAQPGTSLVRILSSARVEIPIELAASSRDRVTCGAACTIRVESMPDAAWSGDVARLAPMVDENSRTFTAYVEVDNSVQPTALTPGLFVRAEVAGPLMPSAISVPRGAIVDDHVFVVNNDAAHVRAVRTRRMVGERAVVTGALRAGDRLILTNLDSLSEGSPVRVRAMVPDSGGVAAEVGNEGSSLVDGAR